MGDIQEAPPLLRSAPYGSGEKKFCLKIGRRYMKYEMLFTPGKIGKPELKNRILMAPGYWRLEETRKKMEGGP